jgi:hypothetical protein
VLFKTGRLETGKEYSLAYLRNAEIKEQAPKSGVVRRTSSAQEG